MAYEQMTRGDLIRLLEQHVAARAEAGKDGIIMSYTGRTAPWQIIRQVKPKLTKIHQRSSVGTVQAQGQNIIMDGENLSAMVTLYKYRGQVDLILTDPPYNTGEDFRYNDKWDKDPNDPDLGELVPKEDGSRHSKWLRFMTPRIWMMREMLKPSGVIAICIDHRELYRLGMLMDEVFGEENRIGIINWQKSYAPKSDSKHISTATEYVLIYAKNTEKAKTNLEARTAAMDSIYGNPDNDPEGLWDSGKTGGNPTAASGDEKAAYGIQSPFTGEIHYPGTNYWRSAKASMKKWLEAWGSAYEEKDIGDNLIFTEKSGRQVKVKALVLQGCKFQMGHPYKSGTVLAKAREAAQAIYENEPWPRLFFTKKGEGAPRLKTYLNDVKKGKVPISWWVNEDHETDATFLMGSTSWAHTESGHSQAGVKELAAVVGPDHGFQTVKPLKLVEKIIQLWCKPDGLVLDPFAGSGTTGHAVLDLNFEAGANRRFILIEQGNTDKGDHYALTLTAERVKRVVTGDWASGKRAPIPGGFQFIELKRQQVDAAAVNALQREEMIDLLLTSHWDKSDRAKNSLARFVPEESRRYLFATNTRNEGFFLIWDGADQPSALNRDTFKVIVKEAKAHGLMDRYHVYASLAPYSGRTVEFYKIPDRVLEHIGFNTRADAYNNETENEQG